MEDTERLEGVIREVEELGLFQAPRRVNGSEAGGAAALEGEIWIEGRKVTIRLVLDRFFPLRLPQFFLRPWDALGVIPHVDQRGFICFADLEGLVLNRRQPVRVVQEAFERMLHVLTDGVKGSNQADFTDEFEAYWAQVTGGLKALSFLQPLDEVCRVIVASDQEGNLYVARDEEEISAFHNGSGSGKPLTIENGLYLPLEQGMPVVPPRPDGPFWTADDVRRILLPALSAGSKTRLRKLMRRRKRVPKYLIVRLIRPSGGETLFGIRCARATTVRPLLEGGKAADLVPVSLVRLDRGFLVQRGGGHKDLAGKRVLLVGCGAVGGYLAFELVKAGMINLTLIDPDMLMPENSYRHVLGRQCWSKSKAESLKKEIEAQLPYARVTAITDHIEDALASEIVGLSRYDLVIMATGNPTVELDMNARIHAQEPGPAAIFTWLEPLGIGGHALLTRRGDNPGCLECLYAPPEGNEQALVNRSSFAASGQSFGRALSGCASLHTPYGSMDAIRTAALAARLAVDALTGKEQGNPLRSWKGDASEFLQEGFHLSNRYSASEAELLRHRYSYRSLRCPVCGEGIG